MKKLFAMLLIVMLVLSFTSAVYAADMPQKEAASKSQPAARTTTVTPTAASRPSGSGYPPGPIQKAERGFMNAAFGWSEIPKRIVDKTKEYNNPIKGLLVGAFQGTCKAFARTTSGVADLVTFPIGSYDKPAVLPDMPAAK